jgi:LPXTG-site transpeptidase (sortase) family protein
MVKSHSRIANKQTRSKTGANASKRKQKTSSLSSWLQNHSPQLLVFAGVTMMAISGAHFFLRNRALSFDQRLVAEYQASAQYQDWQEDQTTAHGPDENIPTHIFIKWFVDTDIETHVFAQNRWTIAENAASYLMQSGKPGQAGNIILYGHNKRDILGNIRALKGGEIIELTTLGGQVLRYQVILLEEVDPKNLRYLQPTDEEVLTIYTCSGLLDSQRFIVRAKRL